MLGGGSVWVGGSICVGGSGVGVGVWLGGSGVGVMVGFLAHWVANSACASRVMTAPRVCLGARVSK